MDVGEFAPTVWEPSSPFPIGGPWLLRAQFRPAGIDARYGYGLTTKERTDRSAKRKDTSTAKNTLADLTGDNVDRRSYGSWLTQITTGAHRLRKTGGTALLFTDGRQLPVPTEAVRAAG